MRVSTAWAQQLNLNAMNSRQSQLSKVQQQLNTGLKMLEPADDPAGAIKVLNLDKSIAKTDQYQKNIASVRARLGIEESALQSSSDLLERAKELTIQANNDSLNSNDRLSIKIEVDQLLQGMVDVANTKNANGEFIFSGDASLTPAFALNQSTGEYTYQGGPQQRVMQISPTRQVADGELGFNVFENISSTSVYANENGKRSIFNTLKVLSENLAATFNPTAGRITGDRFLRYGLDYTDPTLPPTTFDLVGNVETILPAPTVPPTVAPLSAPASIDLTGKAFANVNALATEINNQLAAMPLAAADVAPNTTYPVGSNYSAAMQARVNGNRIEFVATTNFVSAGGTGVNTSIQINNTSGSFLTDAGFSNGQTNTGVDSPATIQVQADLAYHKQLDEILTDLDTALGSVLDAQTGVGIRMNALDGQEAQNEKFILDTKTILSSTQDLDFADAISKFQTQSTALQVAQQTFAKVKALSLFNYL